MGWFLRIHEILSRAMKMENGGILILTEADSFSLKEIVGTVTRFGRYEEIENCGPVDRTDLPPKHHCLLTH